MTACQKAIAEEIVRVYECMEDGPLDERDIIPAIVKYMEPLIALLRESKREHEGEPWPCDATFTRDAGPCSCGADAWNARVDAVLAEHKK